MTGERRAAATVSDAPALPEPDLLDTGPGDVGLLRRAQLRIALGTLAVVVAVLVGLPALPALVPAVARARFGGVPVCWLVLVLGVQPVLVVTAFWQLGRAERAERDPPRRVGRG